MMFEDYAARFLRYARVATVRPFADVVEGGRRYPLLKAETPGSRRLIITAGFHGDETAGPLTLLEHFEEIVAYAKTRDVGLTVYPSLNPSGFEDLTRYNRSGEAPNNDFLRYEVEPGVWAGELTAGQTFLRHALFHEGPKETRALAAELETQPTPHAALDIHQDPYIKQPLSYAYNFGDSAAYRPFVAKTARLMHVARNEQVDDDVHTDEDGLIRLHDGSVTDYFWRRGVPYTVALETTTAAPLADCHAVNLLWIRGFIDLAARR
jgi:Succinylglutamate desuccinylase / Aspartoacylase family